MDLHDGLRGRVASRDVTAIDREKGALLLGCEPLVGSDRRLDVRRRGLRVVLHAGLGQQGMGRDAERLCERGEDAQRRLVQAALDLAQVGVGDSRELGKLAQRQTGQLALARRNSPSRCEGESVTWSSCRLRPRLLRANGRADRATPPFTRQAAQATRFGFPGAAVTVVPVNALVSSREKSCWRLTARATRA